jgi:hypothetical protein
VSHLRTKHECAIKMATNDALEGVVDQLRGAEAVVVVVEQARGGEEEANRLVAEIAVSPGRSAFRQLSRPGRLSCLPRAVSL